MAFAEITSFQNIKIKHIKKLRNKRDREQNQQFVIDDARDLIRAVACGYSVDYVLYCEALANAPANDVIAGFSAHQVYAVPQTLIEKVSYRQNAASVVAVMHAKPELRLADLEMAAPEAILGLVELTKPGNIGALLRTADATGFRCILLIDTPLDIYNPNIIRSSTGACFLNNIYLLSSDEAFSYFNTNQYQPMAAVLDGDASLFQTDFSGRPAIILGTEDQGLPEIWVRNAAQRLTIPMAGTITDSLNVSVSGAVIMYEAYRQRSLI